jgi:hypothetical protein
LVQLLRGQAVLNIHCYKTVDLNMMLRLKDEFNFTIASFHHAHEAFELADRLAKENITSALFADNYAYKMEASEGRADAPQILDAAGALVALKSDRMCRFGAAMVFCMYINMAIVFVDPVLDASNMMMQASVAAHHGFSQARALAAVTSVPANAIGLGDSIGTIEYVDCESLQRALTTKHQTHTQYITAKASMPTWWCGIDIRCRPAHGRRASSSKASKWCVPSATNCRSMWLRHRSISRHCRRRSTARSFTRRFKLKFVFCFFGYLCWLVGCLLLLIGIFVCRCVVLRNKRCGCAMPSCGQCKIPILSLMAV